LLQVKPTQCKEYNVLIYKTLKCFYSHWPIMKEYSCTKQLLGHAIISNIRKYSEIIDA